MIRRSYIDYEENYLCIPYHESGDYIKIPWLENEDVEDLLFNKEHEVALYSDFLDLINPQLHPSCEEEYESIKDEYPWSVRLYEYKQYYIISDSELLYSCPSSLPSLVALPKNIFAVMGFIREYCLPFIKTG